ncbi:hypothetical protein [Priestia aryabhattai]|uniref:hypothetical protein n=1 Tax=Priestia aryabhattai TaxID=412384 RepID=UPI00203AA6DA|nr:hypothetical protein [Priestia aryabhattai]MCM3252448.1 hypothetical protein [Priestia aryabhattai]
MDKISSYKNRIVLLCDEMQKLYGQLDSESKKDKDFEEEKIKYEVYKNLVNTVHNLVSTTLNSNDNLISLVSTLRYTLESLIVTKLCILEPTYIYKIYFQTALIHKTRLDSMISRIKKEIKLLEKLDAEETRLTTNSWKNLLEKINNSKNILGDDKEFSGGRIYEASYELNEKNILEMDNKASEHITLFFEDVENNGFNFQKYLIENQLLPRYREELRKTEEKIQNTADNLATSEYMKRFFDFNGEPKKVWKALEDRNQRGGYRTWNEKATTVGLGDEYEAIYELTSKLLHCVSYSIFTSKFLAEEEVLLIYRQLFQYIKKITTAINDIVSK